MSVETALRVSLQNRPGELARIADQLGKAGVNIRAVAGVASGNESRWSLAHVWGARDQRGLHAAGG
jgi:hypothetical protein